MRDLQDNQGLARRGDGTPMVFKPKEKSDRTSDRRPRSSQNDSSSSSRGGSYYKASEDQNPARRDRSSVQFREQEDGGARGGTIQLSTTLHQPACSCNDSDVDTTYRMCCITVGNSTATLFDTGAHTSFVNREIAAWIELQAEGDKGYANRKRSAPVTEATSVSLPQY